MTVIAAFVDHQPLAQVEPPGISTQPFEAGQLFQARLEATKSSQNLVLSWCTWQLMFAVPIGGLAKESRQVARLVAAQLHAGHAPARIERQRAGEVGGQFLRRGL